MSDWTAPQRPNSYAEHALINAILDGTFPAGTTLPGERDLAAELGITRPTLREAIQRLARDGWVTVQHGKPTQVNDIWQDGGLNILSGLVKHSDHLPPGFITNLLELRLQLAPAYARGAVLHQKGELEDFLIGYANLADEANAFASYDWLLHRQLTLSCGNPIYVLILNGFTDFYEQLARLYFAQPEARVASRRFYAELSTAVTQKEADLAELVTRKAMLTSIELWRSSKSYSGV
jgi:GntR family negative regulator for fad regulon and positive regulator of fabA